MCERTLAREPMCNNLVYTQWRLSLLWLAGPSSTRPLSSEATISRSICLATAAKPHWMKRSGTTWPLRSIKRTTLNTKRIALSSWTRLRNKIGKRTKPSTTSKTQTQPWRFIIRHTEQSWLCLWSLSSRTTTNPARSRRMASCSSSAPAHLPSDMPPFASCKHTHTNIHASVSHAWKPNYRRSTTAPRGTGKGWPPSNN